MTERNDGATPKLSKTPSRRLLTTVILVALIIRLAVTQLGNFENLMNADHIHAWEQGNVARALVAGRGFGSPFVSDQLSAIMPPVFPLIVAFCFKIFGVHTAASIFAIHAFNCLISALACIPLYLIARRSFGERVARWSAWGWALCPYGIYFAAAWAWSTHLLLFCLLWLIYLAQKMEESPQLGVWAGFGLLAGFAALTEPSVLVVVPFLMALAACRLMKAGKRWLAPGLIASLMLAATISPWMVRNAIVFHRFIPMRDSMGLELWMGNNGYTERWTSDQLHPLHNEQELADYNSMSEIAYMDHKAAQAKTYIAQHPGWYAWMSLRRAVYLWFGFWSFDPAYLRMEPTDPANIPFATSLTLFALVGLSLAWSSKPFEVIRYGGVMFLLPAIYYFSHPEPYHLRPLDPLMVMLGAFAIVTVRERVKSRPPVAMAY
jgi:4-amino-4-deoxy-L-arabinose transferase-like glycosyltransferase